MNFRYALEATVAKLSFAKIRRQKSSCAEDEPWVEPYAIPTSSSVSRSAVKPASSTTTWVAYAASAATRPMVRDFFRGHRRLNSNPSTRPATNEPRRSMRPHSSMA
jgi:hypothetical protein